MKVVPASMDHIRALYDDPPTCSFRGVAVVDGERVLGVAGLYRSDANLAIFSKMTDELRQHPRLLIQASRAMLSMCSGVVLAYCDTSIEAAPRFLEHWGFQPIGNEVYAWVPQQFQ